MIPEVPAELAPYDLLVVVQAVLLALGLGLVAAIVHRISVTDRMIPPSLSTALVVLAGTSSLVTLSVGNSLARAFALVGALAVVRFRARIDNPLDVAFVFLSMSAGIASGALAWRVGITGVALIGLAVVAISALPRLRGEIHLVRCDLVAHDSRQAEVHKVLEKHVSRMWLEQARSLRFGETLSLWWRVALKRDTTLEALLRDLSTIEGVERVIALAGDDIAADGG